METATANKFIEKTIQKTKSKELHWTRMPKNFSLRPLPDKEMRILPISIMLSRSLLEDSSFIASYKTGKLMLLTYNSSASSLLTLPPDNCFFSLQMQDDESKYAVEIANSECSDETAVLLIRLYNLLDKDSSSISVLIDDFLNS